LQALLIRLVDRILFVSEQKLSAPIVIGTALSAAQLDATANVPGTESWLCIMESSYQMTVLVVTAVNHLQRACKQLLTPPPENSSVIN
jgi:hypothetical protein